MGIGGTPEGVIVAAALQCIGGAIQCQAWPRDDKERDAAVAAGADLSKVYATDDLVAGEDVFFAATGASTGDLLRGVNFFSAGRKPIPWQCVPAPAPCGGLKPPTILPGGAARPGSGPPSVPPALQAGLPRAVGFGR